MASKTANLAETIFEDLQRRILSGEWKAQDRLPAERELAVAYDTNRNTLREAIRKLEQSRLVTVRRGSGVRVEDFRTAGHFDLLSPFLEHGGDLRERISVLGDLLRARAHILEMVVDLAAERAEERDIDRLRALVEQQAAVFRSGDQAAVARGDLRWHTALVDAARSTTIRWIANTFLHVYRNFIIRFPNFWVLEEEYPEYLRRIAVLIARKEKTAAVEATRDYYRRIDADLMAKLEVLIGTFRGGN